MHTNVKLRMAPLHLNLQSFFVFFSKQVAFDELTNRKDGTNDSTVELPKFTGKTVTF